MQININKLKIKKHHLCIISIILFSTTNIFASGNAPKELRAFLRIMESGEMLADEDDRVEGLELDENQLAAGGGAAGGALADSSEVASASPMVEDANQGGGGMQNPSASSLGDAGLVSSTPGKADDLNKPHGKHHNHHAKKHQNIKQQNNYHSAVKKVKSKNSIWTDGFFGAMEGRPNSGIDKATGNYGYYSLGFNHKLSDKNRIGLIYSYSSDSMNMNNDVKSQEASQGSKVTLHLNHKLTKNIFSDILVGYGVYNQQNTNVKREGKNDKVQFNAFDTLIRLGQDMTTKFGITITPTVGMHYVNKVQSGPSDLGFNNLGYYSVSALLGTKITTNIKLNKYKLQPSIYLNLLQGIKDNYQNNSVLESQKIYSTYNIGLGIQLINSNIFSVDLGYDFFINKQTYNHSGALTLKLAL